MSDASGSHLCPDLYRKKRKRLGLVYLGNDIGTRKALEQCFWERGPCDSITMISFELSDEKCPAINVSRSNTSTTTDMKNLCFYF